MTSSLDASPLGRSPRDAVRTEQHRHRAAFTAFMALAEAATSDIADVRQVLALFGHAVDNDAWDELDPLLAPDVELRVESDTVTGHQAVIDWYSAQESRPAHHTVNAVTRARDSDVLVWSRLVTITGDGQVASADALDRLVRTGGEWQIVYRAVHPKHYGPHPGDDIVHGWLA